VIFGGFFFSVFCPLVCRVWTLLLLLLLLLAFLIAR